MNLVAEHLQKLEEKIKQLTEDHRKIITENSLLKRQSESLKTTIAEQNIEIENFKKQVQALKIAKSVETVQSNEETGKVKEKIQDLVREIDRCIELLNK